MGRFKHEAAAADPVREVVYLTEDVSDGCFYRFRPTTWGDLSSGTLEVLVAGSSTSGPVTWARVPDPSGATATPPPGLRRQAFNGGEGCYYADDTAGSPPGRQPRLAVPTRPPRPSNWPTTTRWRRPARPLLTGVDNVTGSSSGDLLVAEDGRQHGDLRDHAERRTAPSCASTASPLGDHGPGVLARRHAAVLLQPAGHERQLLRGSRTRCAGRSGRSLASAARSPSRWPRRTRRPAPRR